jgi:hypothetical protein
MSKRRDTSRGSVAAATRYRSTSRTAIGWIRLFTHFGVIIAGSRSVR